MAATSQSAISNGKSRSAFVIAQFLFPHPQIEVGAVGSALASSAMVETRWVDWG
jgi:hypothetical protein